MESNRRGFFRAAGTGAAGLAVGAGLGSGPSALAATDEDAPVLLVGDHLALADTQYGKVRGYVLRGVHYFLGIPYGADTAGSNRFLPPRRPAPWSGVRPALWWGNTAPQPMEKRYADPYSAFRDHWNYDDVSEDCLRLNVFTPSLTDGRKRPVLVWLHGGGFVNGNGIEQDGYNGENLAARHDVVFCSINHRLGPLGFCNLAMAADERFAASGNVGMLDVVAALEWVRDNIASFGGDPANVTVMGQSGGGAKVCALTAMPSAKGLFHKAVVLSGAAVRMGEKEPSEKLGAYVLAEAGLLPSQFEKLQQMPWREFYALAERAQQKLDRELGPARGRRGFAPVVDGLVLPQHPYDPQPAPSAAAIPMLVCSTFHEQSPSWTDAVLEEITLAEIPEKVRLRAGFGPGFGEKAADVVAAYAKAFPGKKPVEIWSLVSSNRRSVVALADAKSRQSAPVYVAWFGWQPPLFDGRMRAFHCLDICFWFRNTDVMLTHTGGGARPRRLSEKMGGALTQFMRSGDPNGGGLPDWPRYDAARGATMILDDVCEVRDDPDREPRKALPPA